MDNQIKDIIDIKYTQKTYMERGYDEEVPLISFAPEDLASVIKGIVHVCADMVDDPLNRAEILKLVN